MSKRNFTRCIKCTLAILVLLLWVLSVAVLVLSSYIREDLSHLVLVAESTEIGDFYLSIFFPVVLPVLITVSCFAFVIGCIGCSGAFTESQFMLGWYFFSLLVTFCIELSAGVWRLVNFHLTFDTTDTEQLKANIQRYSGRGARTWFMAAWVEVHNKFECCGVDSYEDWVSNEPMMLATCCPGSATREACAEVLPKLEGCGIKLLTHLSAPASLATIPYLTALLGATQVVALVLALKLWLSYCFGTSTKAVSSFTDDNPTYEMGMIWSPEQQLAQDRMNESCTEHKESLISPQTGSKNSISTNVPHARTYGPTTSGCSTQGKYKTSCEVCASMQQNVESPSAVVRYVTHTSSNMAETDCAVCPLQQDGRISAQRSALAYETEEILERNPHNTNQTEDGISTKSSHKRSHKNSKNQKTVLPISSLS